MSGRLAIDVLANLHAERYRRCRPHWNARTIYDPDGTWRESCPDCGRVVVLSTRASRAATWARLRDSIAALQRFATLLAAPAGAGGAK